LSVDLDAVAALLREVATQTVNPRFEALRAADVTEKSAGEVVTIVDRECEALLVAGLGDLTPGIPVVGEEAAFESPALLDLLETERQAWLVDPLDGTSGFVAGSDAHAVMVALVENGATTAAAIYQPRRDRMYLAERGSGAFADGERLVRRPGATSPADLRGGVMRRFLPAETLLAIDANAPSFGDLTPGSMCAGIEYPLIASGERDFLLYSRTLPWDHAPGALLVTEAGGAARRLDGSDYAPGERGEGLLVAGDAEIWDAVAANLLVTRD
jgi:fructose-1,6-bisphosphatase/inositol monophosphatase family enzyme